MTLLNSLQLPASARRKGNGRKVGEKSERTGGIRKVRGRSELETVWKREGSALKEVILKGAPREWTGRSQRVGVKSTPLLLFSALTQFCTATWATEGLENSRKMRVGVVEESLHFVALLYLGTVF